MFTIVQDVMDKTPYSSQLLETDWMVVLVTSTVDIVEVDVVGSQLIGKAYWNA